MSQLRLAHSTAVLHLSDPTLTSAWSWALKVAERLGLGRMHIGRKHWPHDFLNQFEEEFPQVVSNCDPSRLDNSPHIRDHPQGPASEKDFKDFLILIKVAFRPVEPVGVKEDLSGVKLAFSVFEEDLNHTSHHDRVFKTTFSGDNDKVIADAACVWIIGKVTPDWLVSNHKLCTHYFAERVENARPFSPRLRWAAIYAVKSL